jgi:hypothetical protein
MKSPRATQHTKATAQQSKPYAMSSMDCLLGKWVYRSAVKGLGLSVARQRQSHSGFVRAWAAFPNSVQAKLLLAEAGHIQPNLGLWDYIKMS